MKDASFLVLKFLVYVEKVPIFKKNLNNMKESCKSFLVCKHPWRFAMFFVILLRNLKNDKYYF